MYFSRTEFTACNGELVLISKVSGTAAGRLRQFSTPANWHPHRNNSCVADFAAFLSNVKTGEYPAACALAASR